jgi:acetyl-CoA carboxylase biotin carboxyl carrier protein
MRLKELKKLIDWISEKDFTEFEIEHKGLRIRVARSSQSEIQVVQPAPAPLVISSHVAAAPSEFSTHSTARRISPPAIAEEPEPADSKATETEPEPQDELQIVKSPIVGTFYRAPSPNADPFVSVGDLVKPDTVVCIIEAMKLMNEIQAEVSGQVVKVFVESGQPVEYGQPLFGLKA